MTVDLSKVKSAEELTSAIGGNMTVPRAEQATPLESWQVQEYQALHNNIMAHGRNACESILQMAQGLKRMNEEKLYLAGGYASFEDYTEQAVGLKKSQAYKYISAYEAMGEEFFHSSGKIGITKINLLAGLTEDERAALQEKADVESATVRDLKEQIAQLRGELDEKDRQINETDWNAAAEQVVSDVTDDTAEKIAEAERQARESQEYGRKMEARANEVAGKLLTMERKLEKLTAEKTEMEKRLRERPTETVENPETASERDKARAELAAKETEIEELRKSLAVAGDAAMTAFKVKFEDFQILLESLFGILDGMNEPNKSKCKAALESVIKERGL